MFAPLNDTRKKILTLIGSDVEERGFPPSVRELCERTGLTSPSSIHRHLNWLVAEGYISREPGIVRGIKVTMP